MTVLQFCLINFIIMELELDHFVPLIIDFFLMDSSSTLLLNFVLKQCNNKKNALLFIMQAHSMSPRKITCEDWLTNYNLQFFKLFRMEHETVEKLEGTLYRVDVNQVFQKRYTGGHYPVKLNMQVLIFLYYMATQESLFAIGNRFKISGVSVMNIVNRLLYFILKLKSTLIKFPSSAGELEQVSEGFKNYPGVVGALDGTHVFINVEKAQQDSYIDRYRRHSINVMAICDSNRLFTYVFVGFPGSAHDSRVFENSQLFRKIESFGADTVFHDANNYHLIGDSAFGIKKWLMTPYRDNNNLTRREKHHNYCLSSERVVIEHSFGQLKGRWRRVQFINTYNIYKTVEITTAACILHNFCILNFDLWLDELYEEERIPLENVGANQNEGRFKRERIANELFYNN